MANTFYNKGKQAILTSGMSAMTLKFVLVDLGQYTPNFATHQYLSDIPAGARVSTTGGMLAVWKAVGAWEEPVPEPAVEAIIPPIEPAVVSPPLQVPAVPNLREITIPEPPEGARGVSALLWAGEVAHAVGEALAGYAKAEAVAMLPGVLTRLRAVVDARAPGWLVRLGWPLVEREARRALEGLS